MIIVEGPDNSGKSTLCERLSDELGLNVIHSPFPGTPDKGRIRMQEIVDNPLTIYDRASYISDAVYGPVLREDSIYRENHWKYLDQFLKHRPVIIFCDPGIDTVTDLKGRSDMYGVQKNIEAIYNKYKEVMVKVNKLVEINGAEFMTYCYKTDDVELIVDYLYYYIGEIQTHQETVLELGE